MIEGHSAESYGLRMTGEGLTYWERLLQRIRLPEYNADLATGSLATHWKVQHGVGQGELRDTPPDEPKMYQISFTWASCGIVCSLVGCPGRALSRSALQVHFVHHYMQDAIVVLEEGNHPLPRYPKYDMFVRLGVLSSSIRPQ